MKVGILGGGQLARMIALAGHPLGVACTFIDPAREACAAAVAEQVASPYEELAQLDSLTAECDVVTFEFEHIPAAALRYLESYDNVFPRPSAILVAQDRLREKTLFRDLGIPVPPFASIGSREEFDAAIATIGMPLVIKTRTLGYDGKGQKVIRCAADIEAAWAELGGQPLLAEGFVPFEREVSMIAARDRTGAVACYALSENVHRDGILRVARPYTNAALQQQAEDYSRRVLDELEYVGVLAFEFFVHDGGLLANEIAPRVHNSGHWTIEGAGTSQFENHLRAILGLTLGSTETVGHSAMVNFIGRMPTAAEVFAIPNTHLHHYGKADRPGRKVGHVTVRAATRDQLEASLQSVIALSDKMG
ncbi:MAG: 5-(carboxyamino)imidazole ribonucleotide synthase [Pseudomonadota bacterium]